MHVKILAVFAATAACALVACGQSAAQHRAQVYDPVVGGYLVREKVPVSEICRDASFKGTCTKATAERFLAGRIRGEAIRTPPPNSDPTKFLDEIRVRCIEIRNYLPDAIKNGKLLISPDEVYVPEQECVAFDGLTANDLRHPENSAVAQ